MEVSFCNSISIYYQARFDNDSCLPDASENCIIHFEIRTIAVKKKKEQINDLFSCTHFLTDRELSFMRKHNKNWRYFVIIGILNYFLINYSKFCSRFYVQQYRRPSYTSNCEFTHMKKHLQRMILQRCPFLLPMVNRNRFWYHLRLFQ